MSGSELRFEMLGTQVAQILRAEIVAGTLARGHHLVEATLSDRFQVSRGPIRDALQTLSAEGLVEIRRRGAYVLGLSDEDIAELYSLREALETLATRLVGERHKQIDWSRFEGPLAEMESCAEASDPRGFAVADLAFHDAFYQQSGHRHLLRMWSQIRPTFQSLLDFTNAQDHDLHPALESHRSILDHVRAGRIGGALTELRTHLQDSQARIAGAHERLRTSDGHAG